jgi:hypothetical protein
LEVLGWELIGWMDANHQTPYRKKKKKSRKNL